LVSVEMFFMEKVGDSSNHIEELQREMASIRLDLERLHALNVELITLTAKLVQEGKIYNQLKTELLLTRRQLSKKR
jgi:hypothetical protein